MPSKKVTISDGAAGKTLELPVIKGTEGEPTLDIKELPGVLGLCNCAKAPTHSA